MEKSSIVQFLEDAIAGGWHSEYQGRKLRKVYKQIDYFAEDGTQGSRIDVRHMLLAPLAWQAVGKTRGWGTEMIMIDEKGHPKEWCYFQHCDRCGVVIDDPEEGCPAGCQSDNAYVESWLYEQHRFIDHLADGRTIEEALAAIQ